MSVYDYIIKVLIVGESNVGKTAACARMSGCAPSADVAPTIGVEFTCCKIKGDQDTQIKCLMWDLAGNPIFRSIVESYFREAALAVIVFDLSEPKSFDSISYWLTELVREREGFQTIFNATIR